MNKRKRVRSRICGLNLFYTRARTDVIVHRGRGRAPRCYLGVTAGGRRRAARAMETER